MGDSVVKRPMFPSYLLESICQTIAATEEGLSNREIEKISG